MWPAVAGFWVCGQHSIVLPFKFNNHFTHFVSRVVAREVAQLGCPWVPAPPCHPPPPPLCKTKLKNKSLPTRYLKIDCLLMTVFHPCYIQSQHKLWKVTLEEICSYENIFICSSLTCVVDSLISPPYRQTVCTWLQQLPKTCSGILHVCREICIHFWLALFLMHSVIGLFLPEQSINTPLCKSANHDINNTICTFVFHWDFPWIVVNIKTEWRRVGKVI